MMNLGDRQKKTLSSNYYSNAWNGNVYNTEDVAGGHQYFNDSVCYRKTDAGSCNVETKQMFSKFPNSFKHVDHRTSSPCVTSLGHFQNQNVPTAIDQNQFKDLMHWRLQQNSASSSMSLSDQISLSKYSEQSLNANFQNQYNNCCNELAKFNLLQNPNEVIPFCFDPQSYSVNDFYSAQRVGMQNCSYEENPSKVHSLYEHKSYSSGINSELKFGQSYNINDCRPLHENSTKIQHNIRQTKKPEESNFNVHPHVQMDKNENVASTSVDPYNHHWYALGMGMMKMECWEVIVFCRNHSVYVNVGLIAQGIGLPTSLVRRLVGSNATSERMTQLEVSILKYIKCLSATTHDTGLIPLAYFLITLYCKLNKNKSNQTRIKSAIKTFIDKLKSGFVPAISNIPYDLTSFFHFEHFNRSPTRQGLDNSFKQFRIVSHLVLKNKPFSLIEYNGDFYMHLGEMVSNGLFPSINLVRRKIRKMRLQTKWLDSVESKYLNLSQEQELIRFSDLRILCGLILYLHPNMQNDLLQIFSAMDLPDQISTSINHPEQVKNIQNYLPIANTESKEFQYHAMRQNCDSSVTNNQNQFLWADSSPTSPAINGDYPQIGEISAPSIKNLQSINTNIRMENWDQNCDLQIGNKNQSSIRKENVPLIAEREKSVLQEEKIEPHQNFQLEESIFMDSVLNSKAEMGILDVALQELFDSNADICSISANASSQILPMSDESTHRDKYMTPKTRQDPNECFDCYPTSISVLSEDFQMDKGNDKFTSYINQNSNYVEEYLNSKSVFQTPEVLQKTSNFNSPTFDKVSQMEKRQFIDSAVNTLVANELQVSNNNFGGPSTKKQSKPETFVTSAINTSSDNRFEKRKNTSRKCSQFLNTSNALDESNIDPYNPFTSKDSSVDQNQLSQCTTIHSNILSPSATVIDNKSEISTSSVISNSKQVYNFLNMDDENKFLYTLPQMTLPTLNTEQNGSGSFQEPEKNYPLTMPASESPYFSSKYSQGKTFRNQDDAFQDDLLPSVTHCEIENVLPHSSDSTNNCLESLSDGQMPMSNTHTESLQIKVCSFQTMPGSLENSVNIFYETAVPSGNKSLDYNKTTSLDCISFQVQKSCHNSNDASESMLIFSEDLEKNVSVVENVTSAQMTSCSEIPKNNNTLLITSKENGSSFCTDSSNCETNEEFNTLKQFSENSSKTPKRRTLANTPHASIICTNTSLSPTTTFCQCMQSSPFCMCHRNQSRANSAKNLNQFMRDKNSSKSREIVLNSQTPKSEITLEKSEIYQQKTSYQPCISSTVIERSYKDQSFEDSQNEKLVETDMKESQSSQATSNIQSHDLKIVSLETIDTLVHEINQDRVCDSISQNEKTYGNCKLTLPCFETDICRVSSKETNNTSASTIKESEHDSTAKSVLLNSANKELVRELANSNELHSPPLIFNMAATKKLNADSLFLVNNQFPKEISNTICSNRQNYLHSVASHKQQNNQLVWSNSKKFKKLECQKTSVQNKDSDDFSLSNKLKKKPMTLNDKYNIECAVLDKYKKQFDPCSQTTSTSMGSLKYESSSTETKTQNICEYNFCDQDNDDIFSSGLNYQATTAKQISALDLVNIIKLNLTGNRLHLDVEIKDQARRIFQSK